MPFMEVIPVLDSKMRGLCVKSYPNHPNGCPNFNKDCTCPPFAPLFKNAFDLSFPGYVIFIEFDLGSHVERMRQKHPDWSERQLECCLYWQGTARKLLRKEIAAFKSNAPFDQYVVTERPEAMGMNVTATMENLGYKLEWPPKNKVYKIAFAGRPK